MPRDLHELPSLRDSLSYLYFEKALIERDHNAIAVIRAGERIAVPVASVTVLMLGPGTSITHAAMKVICENGCAVLWCGEDAMRYYGFGLGETRRASQQLKQARLWADPAAHLEVARRMYMMRFPDQVPVGLDIRQLRGLEGVRVRETYKMYAKRFGVQWSGRSYDKNSWDASDPINVALSSSNAALYGLCQAGIVSLGYSTALGFVHTGKQLSFVYDIADLYKMETSVPAAFEAASRSPGDSAGAARQLMRRHLREKKVLRRLAEDIAQLFEIEMEGEPNADTAGALWDCADREVEGGLNYAGDIT